MTEDPPEPDYCAWDLEDTFVISGPRNGNPKLAHPGRRFRTDRHARKWVEATYGRAERIWHPWRWAFRVLRPTAPGGRYTPPEETP